MIWGNSKEGWFLTFSRLPASPFKGPLPGQGPSSLRIGS